jgi:hypothetical protein
MNKVFILFGFVCFSVFFAGCSKPLAPVGHFQDRAIVADGNADEWPTPLRFSNSEHTYQYAITNDNRNVYICIITNNEATILRMLRSGITIYFDNKGEKNKTISLEFPVQKAPENSPNNGNPANETSVKNTEDELLLQSNFFNTTGFANVENGQYNVDDKTSDVKVAIKLHGDSSLIYEAVVPIKDIPGIDPNAKKTKNLSIGIAVSYAAYAKNSNNPFRPSFGMRGMRFGGGGSRGGSSRNQNKEEDEWYTFRPAFNRNSN